MLRLKDNRVIEIMFEDKSVLYLLAETKQLKRLNDYLESSKLSYQLTYVDEPTEEQRINAKLNEESDKLEFF